MYVHIVTQICLNLSITRLGNIFDLHYLRSLMHAFLFLCGL